MQIKNQNILFGYIRKQQNKFKIIIPKIITCYILAFYHENDDYFDMIDNERIIISNDRKTITRNVNDEPWCTCYGKNVISSIMKKRTYMENENYCRNCIFRNWN